MDWYRILIHCAFIIQVYSEVINEKQCQLYAGIFDLVVKGKLDITPYQIYGSITLTQCISKCVHYEGLDDGQIQRCKSFNYHPTDQNNNCELLGEDMKDFLMEHIFVEQAASYVPKYKPNEEGWLHYSESPNAKLRGPTCMGKAKETEENPCGDGACTDSCEDQRGYTCACASYIQSLSMDGTCRVMKPLMPCYLTKMSSPVNNGDTMIEVQGNSGNSIFFVDNGAFPKNLIEDGTSGPGSCTFRSPPPTTKTIRYEPKSCTFRIYDESDVLQKTLVQDTCAYMEVEKLVGRYDKGTIFKSKFGLKDGFKMQVKGAEGVMLNGDIIHDNSLSGPDSLKITTYPGNMFMVGGNTNCTITLTKIPYIPFVTSIWTRNECLPAST